MAYAYPLYNSTKKVNAVNLNGSNSQFSGPEELMWSNRGKNKYYCLDLCNKYNNNSKLKQFHLVTFYFRNSYGEQTPIILRAQLPQQITYSVGGEWGAPLSFGGDISSVIASIRGSSLSMAIDSTIIWTNPKPLTLKLDIPIFDDSETNSNVDFQEVLEVLGRVVLPELGENGIYSTTPGPLYATALSNRQDGKQALGTNSIAEIGQKLLEKGNDLLGGHTKDLDRITVQIGGMLLLDYVAIKDFTVTYANTKQQILHKWKTGDRKVQLLPQLATLSVTIETVTGLTQKSYISMLNLDTKAKQLKKETKPDPATTSTAINNITTATANNVSLSSIAGGGDRTVLNNQGEVAGTYENGVFTPVQNSSPVPYSENLGQSKLPSGFWSKTGKATVN